MANSFFSNAYVQENSWVPTGEPQKLTKEEQAAIDKVLIRDNSSIKGKQMVFFMKNGEKTRTMSLSPYCEQYPAGTRIRVSSVEITELTDGENTIYRASGDEA